MKSFKEFIAESTITPNEDDLTLEDFTAEELEAFMVSEEFEQLDELSKATLSSYHRSAVKDKDVISDTPGGSREHIKQKLLARRTNGMNRAVNKLTKESEETNEDFGAMASTLGKYGKGVSSKQEKIPTRSVFNKSHTMTGHDEKKTSTGTVYTKDLSTVKDEPEAKSTSGKRGRPSGSYEGQYKARSAETNAAARAKRAATKAAKAALTKEDCDEIFAGMDSLEEEIQFFMSEEYKALDELSKSTLSSYVKKASKNATALASNAMHHKGVSDEYSQRYGAAGDGLKKMYAKKAQEFSNYSDNATAAQVRREKGIDKAATKLAKESVEEVKETKVVDPMDFYANNINSKAIVSI